MTVGLSGRETAVPRRHDPDRPHQTVENGGAWDRVHEGLVLADDIAVAIRDPNRAVKRVAASVRTVERHRIRDPEHIHLGGVAEKLPVPHVEFHPVKNNIGIGIGTTASSGMFDYGTYAGGAPPANYSSFSSLFGGFSTTTTNYIYFHGCP